MRKCCTWLAMGLMFGAQAAPAQDPCERLPDLARGSTVNLRIDNDLFGGFGQDQGYSNGFLLTLVSHNLLDHTDDPCLRGIARAADLMFSFLRPGSYDELNMTLGLGQAMYTPANDKRQDLITDDRPYAGALLLSMGYNARKGEELHTSQLRLGMVGPASGAQQVQSWWHGVIGVDRFKGWGNQLHNEPVVQLVHERRRRVAADASGKSWGWDALTHWGASVGNFATYANTGIEWRFGYLIPQDFGTAPLGPAGENVFAHHTARGGWRGHLFASFDTRWVLHDITLDGNTFRASHSVDKRPLVADLRYGVAVTFGEWRFAFARNHRTREFVGQRERPVFGSFTIGREF